MNKFQLNIQFIVCAIAAILVVMGESAMAQRPHDFRSEQIALCAQQAACQPGDTVTVQGQVTCLAANRVAPFSNYLYIELINPSDSVVVRQKVSCKPKGSFTAALPIDPLAAYGIYYIRAYTSLMRNFAPESFATHPLLVGQSFPDFDNITTDGVKCTIIPHGGELCPGALQNVTAYVTNYLNDPIADVTLAVTTQNGDTITSQRTSPSGLAMLSFIPDQQLSYSLQMAVNGEKKVFPMPKCDASKPVLQASVNGAQVRFALLGAVGNLQQLKLYAYDRMNAQEYAGENITGSMERIEEMLDTTIAAYKKQLDALFANQAADIQMDIDTMNAMLAREGLGGKGYLDIKDFMKQYEPQQSAAAPAPASASDTRSEQTMKGSTSNG